MFVLCACFCGLQKHALFVRTCQEDLLAGQVRLFPVYVTCSKHVQISVFPVELSKLADSPVEPTSEKLKVKSYFREKSFGARESWLMASEKSSEGLG